MTSVKVILREDVEKLGQAGDVVDVAAGFARNHLLPKHIASLATLSNLLWLKDHRQKLEQEAQEKRQAAEAQKAKLEVLGDIVIEASLGPTGKLFGRITAQDVADKIYELSGEAIKLDRKSIRIEGFPRGVEEVGEYTADIKLAHAVHAGLNLLIVKA